MFKLFDHLDKALIKMEHRNDFVSKSARIWPSESSAQLLEPAAASVVGGCHRRIFYRLIGEKTSSQMDPIGARRVRTGKAIEADTTFQAMEAGVHVASGVRMYVPKIDLAFELDLVVVDPATGQPVICENKTIYGYMATRDILGNAHHKGKPKLEHVLQTLLYINEIRTGGHLKQVVAAALADRPGNKRNRVEVSQQNLDLIKDDAQIYGKICYETRDTCETKEFDIEIYEDFDGSHYPQIDGDVWKVFTLESIYERFETVQKYYNNAQQAALARLADQNVTRPILGTSTFDSMDETAEAVAERKTLEEAFTADTKKYWDRVGEEMRRLGPEFLPPADYQYRYPDVKIEDLASKGLIGKAKFAEWKAWKNGRRRKAGTPIIGAWQCRYCPFKFQCIPIQYPDLANMVADMMEAEGEDEE